MHDNNSDSNVRIASIRRPVGADLHGSGLPQLQRTDDASRDSEAHAQERHGERPANFKVQFYLTAAKATIAYIKIA